MVDFAVFNELSLPFINDEEIESHFIEFFKCISLLKERNLKTLRTDKDFKDYEIIKGIYFPQFFGQVSDKELQRRIRSFVTNGIVIIRSPLLKNESDEEEILDKYYSYDGDEPFIGGLACSDMWNTITVSFKSSEKWNDGFININRESKTIQVRHISVPIHISHHEDFFNQIEDELKLGISQKNFWENREEFFPNKIIFTEEIKKQIETIDTTIFRQAVGTLRDIDSGKKYITDYNYSPESQSVEKNPSLKRHRMFTINGEKVYFSNHLKNLPNGYRIYFLEKDEKIYIGYIGKHLPL